MTPSSTRMMMRCALRHYGRSSTTTTNNKRALPAAAATRGTAVTTRGSSRGAAAVTTRAHYLSSIAAAVAAEEEEPLPWEESSPTPTQQRKRMVRLEALRDRLREEERRKNSAADAFSVSAPSSSLSDSSRNNRPMHSPYAPPSPVRVAQNTASGTTAPLTPQPLLSPPDEAADLDLTSMLTDSYKRQHTYLRISLSERCNLRCLYCMPPDGVTLQPSESLLSDEEVVRVASLFGRGGVDKVRLTGGEPLLRSTLPSLVSSIASLPSIQSVGITTNGLTLTRRLPSLLDAGLTSINVSLDTLIEDKFKYITRRNGLDVVQRAIDTASEEFARRNVKGRVKINCVVMKGFNDDELRNFVQLTEERDVDVRFIEWMPFGGNGWGREKFVGYNDMLSLITGEDVEGAVGGMKAANGDDATVGAEAEAAAPNDDEQHQWPPPPYIDPIPLRRLTDGPNDTTKWYQAPSSVGRIGFITSMSNHFCATCNRLRITADGNLKTCLFGGTDEVSLRDAIRGGASDGELADIVRAAVGKKKFALGGHGDAEGIREANDNRPMTLIGG